MRRAAFLPLALLLARPCLAGEEVVVRVEARIDGGRIAYRCGDRTLTDLDSVEAWLKERKAKAGEAKVRPVVGGTDEAISKARTDLDERFWRAGFPPPEFEEVLIRVPVREQAGGFVFRCGDRDMTDAAAVIAWLNEEEAKANGAIVRVVFTGDTLAGLQATQFLHMAAAKGNLDIPSLSAEEDPEPAVTPGEAPPSGKVQLEITDEGGLRGPSGDTTLREWGNSLEKAAKDIRRRQLVEHEVHLRVGARTAWGQLQLVLATAAASGYYRVLLEDPQHGGRPIRFQLPLTGEALFHKGSPVLRVDARGVRLRHEEARVVMQTKIRPSDAGPVVTFGWNGTPMAVGSPEMKSWMEGQKGVQRRRGMEGLAFTFDAPPDLAASVVLNVARMLNEVAELVVMTSDATPLVTEELLAMKKLPVPPPPPPERKRR